MKYTKSIFKVKHTPKDFLVKEVSLFPKLCDREDATYTYIWVEKVGYTTFEVQRIICQYFDLNPKDVSAQGLKDEDGITLQTISVRKHLNQNDVLRFNNQHINRPGICTIKEILGYGKKTVTPKALHGNTFTVTVRSVAVELADKIAETFHLNNDFEFINYYDLQRFGLPGGPYNAHLIGELIIQGNWKSALAEFCCTKNITPELEANLPTNQSEENCRHFFLNQVGYKLVSFFISSYNSNIWNQKVSNFLKELSYLNTKDLPELELGKLQIPTTNITQIPLYLSIDAFQLKEEGNLVTSKKNRLLVVPTKIYCQEPESDEFHPGKVKLSMSFFLPTGSYATMLLKQIECRFR
ncbi:tRNA pseudouridine(13) synthase TruD [Gloeothece verrucosa]|uniref:tRNA pseudouridine synthase D TruD n=1 Tax=Gloeothece verrucosa (strain PCC 7822) TaxID=497965 RepID=E0UMY8_GLOV7|nr:tRNA pseudouridine(13) synthase TruD [Gloeothece verrucosa]ADN18318.1 tRNA pseudouridine synthase D TruD [Gloeothece verrucosa PCC 7822]